MKKNDDLEGAQPLVASVQYGDACGDSAADFHDGTIRRAEKLVSIPPGFFPVAASVYAGTDGPLMLTVHAVATSEFGATFDEVQARSRGKTLVLHSFSAQISFEDLRRVFKRLDVVVKTPAIAGASEVMYRDSSWNQPQTD
jgi:hypothetical protein